MKRSVVLFMGIFLAAAFPATAQDGGASAKPDDVVVSGKIPDADKKVCKTQVPTGSIMPKRICRTKGDWEQIRARSLARLERLREEERTRQFIEESRRNR